MTHLFEFCVLEKLDAELLSAQRTDRGVFRNLVEFLVLVEGNKVGATRNRGDKGFKLGSM
jgi:hypothetical protein